MTGKEDDKSLWRPLAHKLSCFFPRLRSRKSRAKLNAASEKPSQPSPTRFKPLEVQSNALEGLHLPNGWLVNPANSDKQRQRLSSPIDTCPAAQDANHPDAPEIHPLVLQKLPEIHQYEHHEEADSSTGGADKEKARESSLAALTTAEPSAPSVLDRGRPVEARHLIPQPKNVKHNRKSLPLEWEMVSRVSLDSHASNSLRPTSMSPGSTMEVNATSQIKELSTWAAAHRRRSTIREVAATSPTEATFEGSMGPPPPPAPKPVQTLQIPLNGPSLLKRHSYQGPPTMNGAGAKPTENTSAPRSISATRKQTGTLNDRLSWIKALEEKENAKPNKELTSLPKRAGSVSDKLAMFEKRGVSAASTKHLYPPTRTNSSSHLSTTGRESVFSMDSAPSARTSVDTARTNPRAASVMSHYDDSFREKLESLVGQESEENKTNEDTTP
ncbi:hypothetical protein FGRMN_169 [Fusarium graminum]|nr:hypothetical protein FGRMN_169 [Fusarium graminum]